MSSNDEKNSDLPNGVTKGVKGPATATLGEQLVEKMMAKTTNSSGTTRVPTATTKSPATVGAFKVSIRKRAPAVSTDEAVKTIAALKVRGEGADEFFAHLPALLIGVLEGQQPIRDEIYTQLSGAQGTAKSSLYERRERLDGEVSLFLKADQSLFEGENMTELEREIAVKVMKVTYVAWHVANCPPRFGAIGWLVNGENHKFNAVALGVLVKAGENDKPFVWVGKKPNNAKYAMSSEYHAAEAIVRKTWEQATGKPYPGIVQTLVGLSIKAKEDGEKFVQGLKAELDEGVTEGATVEMLLSKDGGEVTFVGYDPGEKTDRKEYYPGRVKLFRTKDGMIAPVMAMGGNRQTIDWIIGEGAALSIDEVTSEQKPKDLNLAETALYFTMRRLIKNEKSRLVKRRESDVKLEADIKNAEAFAADLAAKKGLPVLGRHDFHSGKEGILVDAYRGNWRPDMRKRDGFWNPTYVALRQNGKVGVYYGNDTMEKLCESQNFPIGGEFPERSTSPEHADKPYSGVNSPARQLLQASFRREMNPPTETTEEAEMVSEVTEATPVADVETLKPKPEKKGRGKKAAASAHA